MAQLTREEFVLDLVRDVSGTLEDIIGLEEAEGYLAVVGHMMGERLYEMYRDIPSEEISPDRVPEILVDLKRRIGGSFEIESITEKAVTFVNHDCPFGARVEGRKSLCMMTSNVFGYITAESRGYAKVELQKTIAAGDGMCRVVVHFERTAAEGREYYSESGLGE